jgi:hypothetical protein
MLHVCRKTDRILVVSTIITIVAASLFAAEDIAVRDQKSLKWDIKTLVIDSNEGIDIADFNNDGLPDIAAGRNWFAAPEFIPRPFRTVDDWNGYVCTNGDFAYDVNQDGWVDVVAGAFHLPEVYWYENPGTPVLQQGKLWKKHLLVKTECKENEGQMMFDLDQDSIPEWIVNSWNPKLPFLVWKFVQDTQGNPTLEKIVVSALMNGHGLGIGDLNGDGQPDLLFESGWFEAPQKDTFGQSWELHKDWYIHASLPMQVRDLNQDGKADVIVGKGHDYGLYWYEQKSTNPDGSIQWEIHLIDDSFSQPHALHLADIDGDGEEELITGKRVFAHNGQDPGGNEPPCIYYYKWNSKEQSYKRHKINEGLVGIGLQIRTADLNQDGRLDIAVAGKTGTFILFNLGD